MQPITINAIVPQTDNGSGLELATTTCLSPTVVPINQPVTVPPQVREILIPCDVGMLMSYSAPLASLAITAIVGVITENVTNAPDYGYLYQCFFDDNIDQDDIVGSIATLHEPDVCDSNFTDMFCMCDQLNTRCQTCQTADETMSLYTTILHDIITRTVFDFTKFPRNYKGTVGAEAIGPDTILVRIL